MLEFEMLLMILSTCHYWSDWTHFLFACKVSCALSRLRLAVRLNTPSLPNSGMDEDFTVKLAEAVSLVPWGECDIHQQHKRSEKKLISSTADVKQWSSEGVKRIQQKKKRVRRVW